MVSRDYWIRVFTKQSPFSLVSHPAGEISMTTMQPSFFFFFDPPDSVCRIQTSIQGFQPFVCFIFLSFSIFTISMTLRATSSLD